MGRPMLDITGRRFFRLVAIERDESKNDGRHIFWKCKCDCGNEIVVRKDSLLSGHAKSCGCYLAERYIDGHLKTHGMSDSRLYKTWISMRRRCYANSDSSYQAYGGRGITICEEWKNNFQAFADWAYANGYNENKNRRYQSIDRIDVNGNYCPDNCRWADCETQNYNKRVTRKIVVEGKEKTLKDIEKEYGIPMSTLRSRYKKYKSGKYTVEDMISKEKICKPHKNNTFIEVDGVTKRLCDWERETGIGRKTIMNRYKRGIRGKELFEPTYAKKQGS